MKALGVLFLLIAACTHTDARPSAIAPPPQQPSVARSPAPAPHAPAVELVALCELPRVALTEGLSGTWFDPRTRTLFALQDTVPRIVPFAASADYRSWSAGAPIALHGRPQASWDGEGLARAHGEFIAITAESAARIERFAADGRYLGALTLPAPFAEHARENKGAEGLAVSPSGRFLFVANEAALRDEGALATRALGTTVRVLRRELERGRDEQRAYRTEPLGPGHGGDMGVSDLTALGDDVLLVLERGYQSGYGNTVRIFRVDFRSTEPAGGLDPTTPLLRKTLVVDLADLPGGGFSHQGPQPSPILENYEALSLGPRRPDGRHLLFVTADDNARSDQRPRILVLAAALD